ncbi:MULTISPECIES: RHS repeat-associated core domain-containing protein [unclassified Variovorax]|uniref:RHS repeat-associated core domain-containing protein n=1 Tax=unclassified Variovorax TaxID=663243 RepID=UPI000A02C619|nr:MULTISPECIES: RHS repeat-associated core domain-containing protein [unclassified Variovorax]
MAQLSRNGSPLIADMAWNPMGQPTGWRWAFASNLHASRSYDLAGRLTATEFASYVHDAAGRITSLTQKLLQPADSDPTHSSIAGADVTWNVRYDAAGRITGFDAPGNATSFTYDSNGNRTGSTRTIRDQTTAREYVVDGFSNKLMAFRQTAGTASTTVVYEYNAKGDMTGDGLRTYSYNAEGRLSAATTGANDTSPTTRYAHNALGQRVFKTEPLYPPAGGDESDPGFFQGLLGFFTQRWGPSASDAEKLGYAFMYDEEGTLLAETGMGGANSAGSTQYIYLPTANGPMPIAAVINGQIYAVHSDHLNTPRRLTDSQGQAVWQWAYSAFGDTKPTTAHNRFADLDVTPNPGITSFAEFLFNLGYMGMYRDNESGLGQNWNRYYDSRTGRYTQFDPIGLRGGWNGFIYANLNPLMFMDPTGLMGVGSGVYGRPGNGAPAGGSNASIGGGFSFHTPLGIGLGMDGGLARDTNGNTCVYSMICYTVGPGMSAGAGPVTSIGSGPLSTGITDYQGACWTGGAGLVGSGSVLFGSDGSAQTGRGMGGVGGGVSGTHQSCRQQLLCARN